ncbi:type II toxin-antitoxin system RelE/ParE family toxin [Rhizobium sp. 32-5/1]|uniref:type II toxin-antitoxin system RelE/ParE family toxin n=1 Tax=Rhizobium sp. 32-5/1 TaxID=3019602 RepID=UPI00240DBCF5|nr:type II toxin-antitoxin system RelE/ParE family toxin [Rhizobium sp. 32-5/1]WEZ82491.1 type II toxin-antitoxin system RelE/ParE family toxin [Rhizobium sp. 32-5/1]
MIVVFTDEAEQDIGRIVDYIAADNPARAMTFARELIDRCEQIADMPQSFPLVPRYRAMGIRRRPSRGYLIFYMIDERTIHIIHVLNGAQDYEAILFPEN